MYIRFLLLGRFSLVSVSSAAFINVWCPINRNVMMNSIVLKASCSPNSL